MTTVESRPESRAVVGRPAHDTPLLRRLRAEWAPVLDEIRVGALQRELDGELPVDAVRRLKLAGFGAVRVPAELGGRGATLPELTQLWIELAAVDANLPQAFRGHFALAEDRLWQHARGHDQRVWFDRFAVGEMVGNAWSEVGSTAIDTQRTTLRRLEGGDHRLDGTKYYTTGSIFAEWADVYVRIVNPDRPDEADDDFAIALVDTRGPGVTVVDDWDGFGQKGTGSGTTTFDNVRVPTDHVLPFGDRFPYQTGLYQLNLLATLSGIARAALDDVVDRVRSRTRNYSHANAPRVRDDAQVLARVGDIGAAVYAAEAATIRRGRQPPGGRRPRDCAPRPGGGGGRGERGRVVGRAGDRLRPRAPRDERPLRRARGLGDRAHRGARPALAQRPHRGLAQPPDPQVPRRRRPSRQRHPPAVRLVHRRHPAHAGLAEGGRLTPPPRPSPTGHSTDRSRTDTARGMGSPGPAGERQGLPPPRQPLPRGEWCCLASRRPIGHSLDRH